MNVQNNSCLPRWLSTAVFYQIYIQSFCDSNGDGIGDIQGIIEKLDYIRSLGCNAIWIAPCFESPFYDGGYDITDYYQVAPRYGTNSDFERLFETAHKKGLRVCLDFVPGHTSIHHPWFKESCKPTKNKYSNWYIWSDIVWDNPGCDYRIAVIGYAQRDGNFLTNFFWCQPALNYGYANPEYPWQLSTDHADVLAVRKEMKTIMRFWLDMGADGFRVDMASGLVKGDEDRSATIELWHDFRDMLDRNYPQAALISEWSNPTKAIEAGFHSDFMLHSEEPAYTSLFRQEMGRNVFPTNGNSFFDKEGKGDITIFWKSFRKHMKKIAGRGYISIPSGNHDLPRISKARSRKEQELVFAFILTMPIVPFIYYGEEIGMKYIAGLPSKEGGYNRTGSRTPMQWDDSAGAGFSSSPPDQFYLPIDSGKNRPNVKSQESDSQSLLNAVRRLTALRHTYPALQADGKLKTVYAEKGRYPLVYLRQKNRQKILVALNPSGTPVSVRLKSNSIKSIPKQLAGSGVQVVRANSSFICRMHKCCYGIFDCSA